MTKGSKFDLDFLDNESPVSFVEKSLMEKGEIFLYGDVDNKSAKKIIQEIKFLDYQGVKEIKMWINSGGGSVPDGFAIIDAMKMAKAKIITIISGEAASMAGLISVAGDVRQMTSQSVFMAHDQSGGIWGDYTTKALDRADILERTQTKIFNHLKKYTKLSNKELTRAKHGELWFFAEDCLTKKIVDEVIK